MTHYISPQKYYLNVFERDRAVDDTFDISELKIRELPKPPPYGLWLSLLAIGLTLASVRLIALPLQLAATETATSALSFDWLAQMATSAWAVVNLILFMRRRRAFINSMIALLVANMLVLLISAAIAVTSGVADLGFTLMLVAIGLAIGAAWLLYLVRSKHVREVFVH
jgi:hypothetical protein